ncbi:MAG: malto-oligosyltrehalose trehalohydrolase [Spirochaetaceae bacterium]|nr:MAG: malto-oligosyltrehalose trehalohydrolase [Spirochaetaceae bacterium]
MTNNRNNTTQDVFSVWAPSAERVELLLQDGTTEPQRIAMLADANGWGYAGEPVPRNGDRYAFSLDGGPARPDPRARRQPDGVHGFSEWVSLPASQRGDTEYRPPALAEGIIYELHVGTFTPGGTFDAAAQRIPYLRELGVTHVELMPVASASGARGWGYDGVALYSVWEAYGGPEGLVRFVDRCHAEGLAVILDVVYNHLGPEGNYLAEFGPYFTDAYRTPWGMAVNLDGPDSDEVRRFILDNALMWLGDYDIDALRLDAVHALHDESAVHILEELALEVDALSRSTGRQRLLIAESDLNDPRLVAPREVGGYGLDAQWSDDFHHGVHVALTGETHGYYVGFRGVADLAKSLRDVFIHDGAYSPSRRRRHGRPAGNYPGYRFLAYSQNHDQVGNRAQGERLEHLAGKERAKVAAALTLLSPFVPMLFQGEEWAASAPFQYFTDHGDPDLGRAVREGRRREFRSFGWKPEDVPDPQDRTTFDRSVLDWDEQSHGAHADMLAWYRELIGLRRTEPDLRGCDRETVSVQCDPEAGWLHLRRGCVDVVAALGDGSAEVRLGTRAGERTLLLSSGASIEVTPSVIRFSGPGVVVTKREVLVR